MVKGLDCPWGRIRWWRKHKCRSCLSRWEGRQEPRKGWNSRPSWRDVGHFRRRPNRCCRHGFARMRGSSRRRRLGRAGRQQHDDRRSTKNLCRITADRLHGDVGKGAAVGGEGLAVGVRHRHHHGVGVGRGVLVGVSVGVL